MPEASVTVALKVYDALTVAPLAGSRFVIVGAVVSPPGLAIGCGEDGFLRAAIVCPYGSNAPFGRRRYPYPRSSIRKSRGMAASLRALVQ
jgi:hypothetical protein